MKVILKENMDNLGYIGDVVEVNKGYARNYLFPRGLAVEYTSGNLKSMEHLKQKEWEKRNREILEAKELADKINNLNIIFKAKSGKDGKLFGSITNKDIAQYLVDNYQIEIDRKKIEYGDAMKKIGDYPVVIRLHKEVNARLNVIIAPEEDTKKDENLSSEEIKEKAE
jgi:large subunit ribosomal protein L9